MTNVEALKAVYTAIGGSAADVADVKTTAKVIEKISEIATPGGGGGNSVIISGTYDEDTGIYSLDKTWNEMRSMLEDGTRVVHLLSNNEPYPYTLSEELFSVTGTAGTYYAGFARVDISEGDNPGTGYMDIYVYYCDDPDGYPGIED